MENEKKGQPQYQTESQETLVTDHQNLGLDAAETIQSNNAGEHENVSVLHAREKLLIVDSTKIKHERAKETGEETDTQLPKTEKESKSKKIGKALLSF